MIDKKIYEELDDAKAEIEKLRAENRAKAELSEGLKSFHNKQLDRIQEISLELEKQRQELNEKTDELSVTKQMLEDLKGNLNEKEGIIKHLNSENDKLRVDHAEKICNYEEENRELISKLAEETEKNTNNVQTIRGLKEDIESLKENLFSVSEKKRGKEGEMGKASKVLRQRDEVVLKLEDKNRVIEDKLKRKTEQFQHLKEAHEKLKDQLREKEKTWEKEKSTLLDAMDTLENNLDSQTRISKDLQSRLQMCNEALAHEESRRRRLEVQLLESKNCFDNISMEFEEAKLKLECISGQRDKEITNLRGLLGIKETFYKDEQYKVRRLEQENQELKLSLKEFQEAQIQEVGSSSVPKLKNKLKGLEQIRRECSTKLRAKEAEWSSEKEKLSEDLNRCKLAKKRKGELVEELKVQLMLQAEESSVMLLVLKSEFMEAYLKLAGEKAVTDLKELESETKLSLLNNLKDLEQIHGECSSKFKAKEAELRAKEAEWSSEKEKLSEDLNRCKSAKNRKGELVKELKVQLMLQAGESSVMLLVLKSEFMEAYFKLAGEKVDTDLKELESETNLSLLNKLKDLKQIHEECSSKFKAKEAEWISEKEKLSEDLYHCRFEQESKEELVMQLMLQIEEFSLISLVLKSELMESYLKLAVQKEERETELSLVKNQLEMKNAALAELLNEVEEEHEKVEFLSRKMESFILMEQKQLTLQTELNRQKEMVMELKADLKRVMNQKSCEENEAEFEESSLMLLVLKSELMETHLKLASEKAESQTDLFLLKEQLEMKNAALAESVKDLEEQEKVGSLSRKMESFTSTEQQKLTSQKELDRLKGDLNRASDALDKANEELAQKFCEVNEAEFELQIWKSIAERLKANVEENYQLRKELEASLLEQVSLEVTLKQEKEKLVHLLGEKDGKIDNLQEKVESLNQELKTKEKVGRNGLEKEMEVWENEWVSKELERAIFAQLEAERMYEHEKKSLHQLVDEKGQRIADLQEHVRSLEQEFENSTSSFSCHLRKMQAETSLIHEAWEKFKTTVVMKQVQIEEKNLVIGEMENDFSQLQEKLELQEKTLSSSMKERKHIEVELELKEKEIRKLSDRISKFYGEDMQLMGTLERIVQDFDSFKEENVFFDPVKENLIIPPSPTAKNVEKSPMIFPSSPFTDERSPLRALNS